MTDKELLEIAKLTHMVDELNSSIIDMSAAELTRSYREGITEGKRTAEAEIASLKHQHKNDEAANQMLSGACAHLRECTIKECAALFSGGARNKELYVNDIEESILNLLESKQ